jgi:nucleoside-diphosphate-sugar epimerase
MRVLYIGGTGDISYPCLLASVALGHDCAVFNRGRDAEPLPECVRRITGDLADDASYAQLGQERWDIVCQFKAYSLSEINRDLSLFSGKTGQYLFISTASAYRKPPQHWRITEDEPLSNPFWPYSQAKADMEARLFQAHQAGKLPVTVVRPSHTYRRRFPGTFISGDDHAWRMLHNRPVIIHGDGQALWTLTHADDFAPPFVKLLGHPKALGQAFHIMTDSVFTWDHLFQAVAAALNVQPRFTHVPTQALVRYNPDWAGPLLGDKAWTTLFNTDKLQSLTGPLPHPKPLAEGFAHVAQHVRKRLESLTPDEKLHAMVDRIAAEQDSLGA